ncbi:retrovirus-related pol polyprotein from transposon TNT 1-94 [Tanacetum coccineum]
MGIFWETLAEGTKGALGRERPRVYSDLSPKDKDRYNANIRATNILLHQKISTLLAIVTLMQRTYGTIFVTVVKLNRGLRDSNYDQLYAYLKQHEVKCYNCNGICHIARNCTQPKRPQNFKYFKDKMLLMQAQENRVALDEEQLLFLAGGQDNSVDEDVDEQHVQDLALNVDNVF